MRQQRNEIPPTVENIGRGKWHLRWDVQEKQRNDENESIYFDYNEVELDHEPSGSEQIEIIDNYEDLP